jgi:hypothetical protein
MQRRRWRYLRHRIGGDGRGDQHKAAYPCLGFERIHYRNNHIKPDSGRNCKRESVRENIAVKISREIVLLAGRFISLFRGREYNNKQAKP